MKTYLFRFQLINGMSGPLGKIMREHNQSMLQMERWQRKFGGGFGRMLSAVNRGFRGAAQSVEQLRRGLLGLPSRIKLSVDSSGITKAKRDVEGLRDAQGRLRDNRGRFLPDGGGGSSGGKGLLAKLGLGGISAGALGGYLTWQGLKQAAGLTLTPAMSSERNRFTAGVMLKSPEKAAALDDEYRKYAQLNPILGYKDVQGAGTQLVGVEEQYKRIMPIVKMMSDVAVGSGGNGQTLQEVVGVLGKIKSAGHLSAEELDQFTDRKIMLRPYLAKALGKKQEELPDLMRDGRISYENVLRAFSLMTNKGGIYENISERVGKETTEGKWNTLKEDFEQRFMDLGTKLLPTLNKTMDWFIQFTKQAEGPFTKAFQFLSDSMPALGSGLKSIMEAFGVIKKDGTATEGIIKLLAGTIGGLGVAARILGTALGGIAKVINEMPVVKMTKWLYNKLKPDEKPTPLPETPEEKYRRQGKMFRQVEDPNFDPAYMKNLIETNQKLGKTDAEYLAYLKRMGVHRERSNKRRGRLGGNLKADESLLGSSEIQQGRKKKDSDREGLSATVAGARSNNITINLKELVGTININSATLKEGVTEMRDMVIDELTRVLNSANAAMPS